MVALSALIATRSITDPQFGADTTGASDSQAAIQAAIDASAYGDIVYLPPGSYKVLSTITLKEGVSLLGSGNGMDTQGTCKISFQPSAADTLFDGTATPAVSPYYRAGFVEGLHIAGDGTTNSAFAFDYDKPAYVAIRNCYIDAFHVCVRLTSGIHCKIEDSRLEGIDSADSTSILLEADTFDGTLLTVDRCALREGHWGIIGKNNAGLSYNRVRIRDTLIESTHRGSGQIYKQCTNWHITGCESENVCSDNLANSNMWEIGVTENGTATTGATAFFTQNNFKGDNQSNQTSRLVFSVDRGWISVNQLDVGNAGAGVVGTTSLTNFVTLRDVNIADDEHELIGWTRAIDDIRKIDIDNCGWGTFRIRRTGSHVTTQTITLSGASTATTMNIPDRCRVKGVQFYNATTIAGSPDAHFTGGMIGGNPFVAYDSLPASAGSERSRVLVGQAVENPDLASDDHLAYVTTAANEITVTGTAMSGTLIVVCHYDLAGNSPGEVY